MGRWRATRARRPKAGHRLGQRPEESIAVNVLDADSRITWIAAQPRDQASRKQGMTIKV